MSPPTEQFHDQTSKHPSDSGVQGQPALDAPFILAHLANFGWKPADWVQPDITLECWSGKGMQHGQVHVRVHETGVPLVFISLPELRLSDEHELFSRFLDLAMETRMALSAARILTQGHDSQNAALLLWHTEGRLTLNDLDHENRLESASTPEQFGDQLMPLLAAPAKLLTVRTHSTQADPLSLRQWVAHWGMKLGAATGLEPEHAERFVWQWLILLQLHRYTSATDGVEQWGILPTLRDRRLRLDFDALNAGDALLTLLESFGAAVRTSLMLPVTDEELQTLQQIEDDSILDQLRAELLMIRRSRLEAEAVAWIFTNLDREQEGWRLEVRGVEPIRRRLKFQDWSVYQPLTCDFGKAGLTHALAEMDRLADFVALQQEHDRLRKPADDRYSQPDLFLERPAGLNSRGRLTDEINYILGNTIRITGIAPGEHFGVALTILLKCFALIERHHWVLNPIVKLDHALGLAPKK